MFRRVVRFASLVLVTMSLPLALMGVEGQSKGGGCGGGGSSPIANLDNAETDTAGGSTTSSALTILCNTANCSGGLEWEVGTDNDLEVSAKGAGSVTWQIVQGGTLSGFQLAARLDGAADQNDNRQEGNNHSDGEVGDSIEELVNQVDCDPNTLQVAGADAGQYWDESTPEEEIPQRMIPRDIANAYVWNHRTRDGAFTKIKPNDNSEVGKSGVVCAADKVSLKANCLDGETPWGCFQRGIKQDKGIDCKPYKVIAQKETDYCPHATQYCDGNACGGSSEWTFSNKKYAASFCQDNSGNVALRFKPPADDATVLVYDTFNADYNTIVEDLMEAFTGVFCPVNKDSCLTNLSDEDKYNIMAWMSHAGTYIQQARYKEVIAQNWQEYFPTHNRSTTLIKAELGSACNGVEGVDLAQFTGCAGINNENVCNSSYQDDKGGTHYNCYWTAGGVQQAVQFLQVGGGGQQGGTCAPRVLPCTFPEP